MQFDFSLFLMALGLAAVMESVPWLISPDRMRNSMMQILSLPPEILKIGCIIMMLLGLLLCAAGRYLK